MAQLIDFDFSCAYFCFSVIYTYTHTNTNTLFLILIPDVIKARKNKTKSQLSTHTMIPGKCNFKSDTCTVTCDTQSRLFKPITVLR